MNLYRDAKVCNLEATILYHNPIFLELVKFNFQVRRRAFSFENAWLHDDECKEVVARGWSKGEGESILTKIKHCGEELQNWSVDISQRFKNQIKLFRAELKRLRLQCHSLAISDFSEKQKAFNLVLMQQEVFLETEGKAILVEGGRLKFTFLPRYGLIKEEIKSNISIEE